jgi:hypothetical protein
MEDRQFIVAIPVDSQSFYTTRGGAPWEDRREEFIPVMIEVTPCDVPWAISGISMGDMAPEGRHEAGNVLRCALTAPLLSQASTARPSAASDSKHLKRSLIESTESILPDLRI